MQEENSFLIFDERGKIVENDEKIITPDEALKLDRFSFGCYSLQLIWAICNKCWEFVGLYLIILFFLILFQFPKPIGGAIVNVIYFIFSFYALRLSYKRQNKDIDSFLKSQKKWDIAGGVIFIIVTTVYILFLGQHI